MGRKDVTMKRKFIIPTIVLCLAFLPCNTAFAKQNKHNKNDKHNPHQKDNSKKENKNSNQAEAVSQSQTSQSQERQSDVSLIDKKEKQLLQIEKQLNYVKKQDKKSVPHQARIEHHKTKYSQKQMMGDLDQSLKKLAKAQWTNNPNDDRGQGNNGKPDMLDPFGHGKDSNRKELYGNNGRVIKDQQPVPDPKDPPVIEEPTPDPEDPPVVEEPTPDPEVPPVIEEPTPNPDPKPTPPPLPEVPF